MDPGLIPRLKEYDRDNIPPRTIDKVGRGEGPAHWGGGG